MTESDETPAPPRAGVLFRLALVAAALAGTLAALELILRLATGSALLSAEPRLTPRGLTYAPGQRARFRGPEWDVEIATNAQGFRDDDRAAGDGRAGSIVVLGSSFVEGHGVALADTFAKRLQACYRERGQDVWVYNAGHHGTSLARQRRVYAEVFRAVPDCRTVLLALCINQDLCAPGQPDVAPPQVLVSPWKVFLGEHSALYNLVNRRVKSSAALRRLFRAAGLVAGGDVLAAPPYDAAATAPLFDHSVALIEQLAAQAQADGRRLVVALLPMKEQVLPAFFESLLAESAVPRERVDLLGAHHRMASALARAGIPVVDLLPALSTPPADVAGYFFAGDRHYTPRGHAAIARALLPALAPAR